ncbi:MAG: glycosyltransferase family 2 protein [Lachnospiraceae bacterium]|nr:glycosyltransferase family 2 protein [Lachnospiraceae bacterium]
MSDLISIIVPCYNEEESLRLFHEAVKKTEETMPDCRFEILLINDGSRDRTLEVMRELAAEDPDVSYYSFSRNFGKEAAMYAGFCHVKGDYAAVMDADLQDPPDLLPQMYQIIKSGEYDSVAARRVNRAGEPPVRSWFARRFYSLINKISDADIVDGARDFRLMKREMVEAVLAMGETNRFSKGIFGWIGFRTYWMPYENVERVAGQTKWNFWGLFSYALDGIVNFSRVPLDIASWFGILMTIISFLAILFIVLRKLLFGDPVAGWASTACIITFIGGIQLLCLGIIGKYLATVYSEVKKRPHFIISESNRDDARRIG